jgi:class 3 adenylate cyclase
MAESKAQKSQRADSRKTDAPAESVRRPWEFLRMPAEAQAGIFANESPAYMDDRTQAIFSVTQPGLHSRAKSEREQDLEQEIGDLRRRVNEQQRSLEERVRNGTTQEGTIATLRENVAALEAKETLSFVLNRIHERARKPFLESQEFQDDFLKSHQSPTFVMSVDLRRSTELMLKSRRPEFYAHFITQLSDGLRAIILEHHGVFDKFTGDGILAFFPEFYSGPDAGFYAILAAQRSHELFGTHYRKHYKAFHTVLKGVGLGIGIDFGDTHLVRVSQDLAIVGTPVVYACRMAGAEAGITLLNQPAYEQILEKFSAYCSFRTEEIDIKHEGLHLAYAVSINEKPYEPQRATWLKYVRSDAADK